MIPDGLGDRLQTDVAEAKKVVSEKLQTVTVQDVVLVVLCALAIYLLRVREQFILQPQWRRDFDPTFFSNGIYPNKAEQLPLPVITDLESDGVNEIVMLTNKLQLEVHAMPPGPNSHVLPHVIMKNFTDLPVEDADTGKKHRPIAMDAGFLTKYEAIVQVRKQVIVVVLDNWKVLCYDSQLNLLWHKQLMPVGRIPDDYHVKSIGVLIIPTALKPDDWGTIVVGGNFAHKKHTPRPIPAEEMWDKTMNIPPPKFNKGHRQSTVPEDTSPYTHFSTFAMSGNDGTIRWHHLPEDFKPKHPKPSHKPFHWKLAMKHGSHHTGEEPWLRYSQDLIKQMPYHWDDVTDTRFELLQLRKDDHIEVPKDTFSEASTAVHDVLGTLSPDHLVGYAYGGMRPHSRHEHVVTPNAIIIHNHDGIEALSLTSGRPITKISLPEDKVTFADVNGDGNMERVKADLREGICQADVSTIHIQNKEVFRGPLCESPSLWGSLSLSYKFWPDPEVNEDTHVAVTPLLVESVAVRSSPFQHLMGHSLLSQRKGYDSIFLVSTGRLTSYGPSGEFNWQVRSAAQWAEHVLNIQNGIARTQETSIYKNAFKPSSTAFSPKIYGKKTAGLLLGWDTIVAVDLVEGRILDEHSLPCQPMQSPLLGDFNNDGRTDFIISCPSGYISFVILSKPNYIYMVVVAASVVLGIMTLTWCCHPGRDEEEFWT